MEKTVANAKQEMLELTGKLQAVEQVAEQLQKTATLAQQARNVFLTSISHELCTPLNGILGYAAILRKNPNLDSAMVDGLDVIMHSGQRLESMINDLLDGVRIASGQLLIHPEPLQPNEFTEHIRGLVQPKADLKGLMLYSSVRPGVPDVVLADEARLRQVVLHLLGCAVRNTEQGHVALTIEVLTDAGLESGEACLRFAIENTGKGIDPVHLKRAALPVDQGVLTSHDTELRLMICHSIIKKMGGCLQVESTSTLTSRVWFDVVFPTVATHSQSLPLPVGDVRGYEGNRCKLLVVDDKPYNRMLLRAMLDPLGFEIVLAENGREAVDQAITLRPDAILLDLVMPVMSGFDACQAIRHHPELEGVVIIAVSASVSDAGRKECLELGFDAYLAKPIRVEKLLNLIGDLLALKWIYEAAGKEKSDDLVAPPTEDLLLLKRLSEEGQVYEIQKVVMELERRDESYAPFCQQLMELSKNFELERIANVVEQFLE